MTTPDPEAATAATAEDGAQETPPTPQELAGIALRLAVLAVRADDASSASTAAKATYQMARQAAATRFALARKLGIKAQAVMLPGGIEAGSMTIKPGAVEIAVREDELLMLVATGRPGELEDYVTDAALLEEQRVVAILADQLPDLVELRLKDGALDDDRAVKLLAEHAPDLVKTRIRPMYRAGLIEEIAKRGDGHVADPATGELVEVADVVVHDPTGEFTYTGQKKAAEAVRRALECGQLQVAPDGTVTVAGSGDAA